MNALKHLHLEIPETNKKRVIIIGGGFAGVHVAKGLKNKIMFLVAPPGWTPDGSRLTSEMIKERWHRVVAGDVEHLPGADGLCWSFAHVTSRFCSVSHPRLGAKSVKSKALDSANVRQG